MPKIQIAESNITTSTPLNQNAGTPIAILGTATKGTRLTPVAVATVAEFESVFGTSEPSNIPYGYITAKEVLYSGTPVVFVRLAQESYTKATVNINGKLADADTPIIKVEATQAGTDGNFYSFKVSVSNDDVFTVSVYYKGNLKTTGTFTKESGVELITLAGLTFTKILSGETPAWSGEVTFTGTAGVALTLAGGTDGDVAYTSTNIANLFNDVKTCLLALQDTSIYDYSILMAPGLSYLKNTTTYLWQYFADLTCGTTFTQSSFSSVVDKIAVMDCSQTTTYANIESDLGLEGTESLVNVSFFYPWYQGTTVNNSTVRLLPPTLQYARTFASLQADGVPCRPVAGPTNSTLSKVTSVTPKIGALISEDLTSRCINPITFHRNYGYFIDGNTVYNPDANSKSYQQMNVRQTINFAKKLLNELCYKLAYSVNTSISKTQFQGEATAILEKLKVASYLYAYSVVVADSASNLANGVLSATVTIFPTPALEEFVINLQVTNQVSDISG